MQYSTNYNFKKPDRLIDNYDIRDQNDNWDAADTELKKVNDKLVATPMKTTTPLKLYVNVTTGNDANDGKTMDTAFKTIQKALDSIPQILNHDVTINIADGTYPEDLKLQGIYATGNLTIQGNNATPGNVNLQSLAVERCYGLITLSGFTSTSTVKDGVGFSRVYGATLQNYRCVSTSSTNQGITVIFSNVRIYNSVISNRSNAIYASYGSMVYSDSNTGNGNSAALRSTAGSIITKVASQPSGAIFEVATNGSMVITGPLAATVSDITLYVSPSGNDGNDGLTAGTALRTIQAAVNRIPQILNHAATINVAPGVYNESVYVSGFTGKGFLDIFGDTVISDNYQVNNFVLQYNTSKVTIRGFKLTSSSAAAVQVYNCLNANVSMCRSNVSALGITGIFIIRSLAVVSGCEISNKQYAIAANEVSSVFSSTNSGSGNSYGLGAFDTATIGKFSTQPTGATAENTAGGGVIR